jgi:hypothetical protein
VNESSLRRQAAGTDVPAVRRHRKYPAKLTCATVLIGMASTGCASQAGSAVSSGLPPVAAGTLRVTVIRAGGPALPGGKTPTSPVASTEVKVAAAESSSTAETNKTGVVTFRLAYGTYSVLVAACGSTTSQPVTVTAASVAKLTWTCPVP